MHLNGTILSFSKRLFGFYINIFFLLAISLNGFYFLDSETINIMGISYKNIAYLLAMVWIVLKFPCKKPKNGYHFQYLILSMIPLSIIGASVSWIRYGGSIFTFVKLIKDEADIWLLGLLYFPLVKVVKQYKITVVEYKKCIECFSIILLTLTIIQYFTYPHIVFLKTYTGIRYDQMRFFYQTLLFTIFMTLQLEKIIIVKNRAITIRAILGIMAVLFEFMVVEKFRNTTMCALMVCAFAIFFWKGISLKKVLAWALGIVAALYLLQTQMVQDVLKTVLYGDTNVYTNTTDFRNIFSVWVVSKWIENPLSFIFGQGIVSGTNGSLAAVTTGIQTAGGKIFIAGDHGIVAWVYMFGLTGVIWFLYMLYKCAKTPLSSTGKASKTSPYFLVSLMLLLQSRSETPWYNSLGMIIMVIFIGLMECEYNECNEKRSIK